MMIDYFDNHEQMCDYMIDMAQNGFYVVAALFYEDAMKLIREIMLYTDIKVPALEIVPFDYNGYNKEYYISLTNEISASVEPAWFDEVCLNAEADLLLIDGNVSPEIYKDLNDTNCHVVKIGEHVEEINTCEEDSDIKEDAKEEAIEKEDEADEDENINKDKNNNVKDSKSFNDLFGDLINDEKFLDKLEEEFLDKFESFAKDNSYDPYKNFMKLLFHKHDIL